MSDAVSVLGPKGTFSDIAARKLYPNAGISYVECVDDVFQMAEKGGLGVVALENSLEGSVGATMHGLLEYDVRIVAQTVSDISHCLMSRPKQDIKRIMSHSHALAQCRGYLMDKFPNASIEPCASTVAAMDKALVFDGCAAIGPFEAGRQRGLLALAKGIEDNPSQTRFVAIAHEGVWGPMSSVIFAVRDEPGALYSIIRLFADMNINMTKIESRPSRKKLGEYVFFADFENGGLDRQGRDTLIERIRQRSTFFKDLGAY